MGFFKKKEQPQPQYQQPQQPIKFCRGCGAAIPETEMTCPQCGYKERLCKKCGKAIPITRPQCMYCGFVDTAGADYRYK